MLLEIFCEYYFLEHLIRNLQSTKKEESKQVITCVNVDFMHVYILYMYSISGASKLIGYALYYYIYSTWEGKCIYMEDFYVSPEYRGKGVGSMLMGSVCKVGQLCLDDWTAYFKPALTPPYISLNRFK